MLEPKMQLNYVTSKGSEVVVEDVKDFNITDGIMRWSHSDGKSIGFVNMNFVESGELEEVETVLG